MSKPCLRICLGLVVVTAIAGCAKTKPQAGSLRTAVHLLLDGEPKEALDECDTILKANAEHFEAHLLRGEICEALQRRDDAELSYQRALKLQPDSKRAQLCLARLLPPMISQQVPNQVPESGDPGLGLGVAATDLEFDAQEFELLASTDATSAEDYGADDSLSANSLVEDIPVAFEATEHWQSNRLQTPRASQHLVALRAIEAARLRDQLAREQTREAAEVATISSLETDAATPKQVVRFDLSVGGADFAIQGSQTRTTGHSFGVSQLPAVSSARGSANRAFQIPSTRSSAARRC